MYLSSKTRKIYEERLESLRKQRADLAEDKRVARDSNAGYEEKKLAIVSVNEEFTRLTTEINSIENTLREAVMVERQSGLDDKVDLGDKVTVLYEGAETPHTFTLVSTYLKDGDVSISSPLGAAVYLKHLGDTCEYSVMVKRQKREYKLTIVGLENADDLTTELENE